MEPGQECVLGRDASADLRIDDREVSRRHTRFYFDAGWRVQDLGSTNGTWLDGRRVDSETIPDLARIHLGRGPSAPAVTARLEPATPPAEETDIRTSRLPSVDAVDSAAPLPGTGGVPSLTYAAQPVSGGPHPPPGVWEGWTLGRDPACDLVVDDLLVSRVHARVRPLGDGRLHVRDVGSANGTFVDGIPIVESELRPGQLLGVGGWVLAWDGEAFARLERRSDVALSVRGVDYRLPNGRALLEGVDVDLAPGSLTAVIGPSGAGKSSLFAVLTGARPASAGAVAYQGLDVHRHYAVVRHQIGVVPQDDLIHRQLSVRQALRYAAELRFPADLRAAERIARVEETIAELGLSEHAGTRVGRLSGGQRKRTSVAMELLTRPALLFLDEPTSGLDPGLDKSVMATLRDLATGDRTVVVVTHSVANLGVCDNVLVLAPGGRVAYFGAPSGLRPYFGVSDHADLFTALSSDPVQWQRRFEAYRGSGPRAAQPGQPPGVAVVPPRPSMRRQISTIGRRQVRIMLSDVSYAAFNGFLPVVLALLALAVPGVAGFTTASPPTNEAMQLLVILIVGATFMGTSASVRDLVGERGIYLRERAVGLAPDAYYAAKAVVFGVLTALQGVLLVSLVLLRKHAPEAHLILPGSAELTVVVVLASVTGALCGLVISAYVTTSEQVMPLLVVSVMAQLVLCGGLIPIAGRMPLGPLSWLAPARWSYAAAGSSVNLRTLFPAAPPDRLWTHDLPTFAFTVLVLVSMNVLSSMMTLRRLRRIAPA